jgi:hypothetical protein
MRAAGLPALRVGVLCGSCVDVSMAVISFHPEPKGATRSARSTRGSMTLHAR